MQGQIRPKRCEQGKVNGPWKKGSQRRTSIGLRWGSMQNFVTGLARGSRGRFDEWSGPGLVKSDFLMRSLGRPNRDQIVTSRPADLTTLEAIDLSNGETLALALKAGAESYAEDKLSDHELVKQIIHCGADATSHDSGASGLSRVIECF